MRTNERVLRDLAAFTGTDAPVTSLYLDVDGRRYVRPRDIEPYFDGLLRRARAHIASNGLSRAAQASVEADLAKIQDHVRGHLHRSHTRGLAMFSCSAHGLWHVSELPVPVRNRVVVNHTPYIRELEAVLARHDRLAVLLADRQRARLLLFELGELVDKTELMDRLPRHDDDGGEMTRDQAADHSDAAAHRHLRRAAQVAFGVFRAQGFDDLLIGAPDDIAKALERELHPYLRDRIAARLSVSVAAPDDEIRQAALSVEADVERAKEAALVARLRDALGTGRAGLTGLESVLGALVARRVEVLLVSEGYEAEGWRCPSCAYIGLRGRRCPVCDSAMDVVEDVVEEAVEEALAQSCRVAVCAGNADLDVLGRIAALLRY